jgi:hypothetical protein
MQGRIWGGDQKVDVDQKGNYNFSSIYVDDGLSSTGNFEQFITVLQKNDHNWSDIDVDGGFNKVTVEQAGVHGTAGIQMSMVDVDGNNNIVKHFQTKDGEGSPGIYITGNNYAGSIINGNANKSIIGKTLGQEGIGNAAIHIISGDDNKSFTDQDGGDNMATITQAGTNNYAKQVQDVYNANGSEEGVYQNNEADENWSFMLQAGSFNTAKAYQFGDDNEVQISQMGSNNEALVDQGIWNQGGTWNASPGGLQGGFISNGNSVDIMQVGSNHVAKVLQLGNSNTAIINQQP